MRQAILVFAKLGLSIGLIWFVFSKLDADAALSTMAGLPAYAAVAGLCLIASQLVFGALRLQVLLSSIGARLRLMLVLDACFIGAFFSQTMISFIGGDAMRVWRMIGSSIPIGNAARAVLYDRVLGFLGLVVLIVLGLPALFSTVTDTRVHFAILLLIGASVAGCIVLLSLHRLPAGLRRWRIFVFVAAVAEMGHQLVRMPARLLAALLLSVILHLLTILAMFAIAKGLNVRVELTALFVLVPPVIFLSMMPISVAGWGVREGAMVAALSTVQVPASQALAVSICFGLGLIIASLPGGLLWLVARRSQPGPGKTASST